MLFNFEGSVGIFRKRSGGVAQLGEHLPCTQRVRSSILLISTTYSFGSMREQVNETENMGA